MGTRDETHPDYRWCAYWLRNPVDGDACGRQPSVGGMTNPSGHVGGVPTGGVRHELRDPEARSDVQSADADRAPGRCHGLRFGAA